MMDNTNKNRYELLKESYGSARARLTRMLLFQLVVENNRNICFRCGKKIEEMSDFSIEHKESWQKAENPKKAFFDLNNIAFSHLMCNAKNGGDVHTPLRGEEHINAKLSWEKVEKIRERLKNGEKITTLAREYDVSERSITLVRDNISWKESWKK
jgi:hypothetical protein